MLCVNLAKIDLIFFCQLVNSIRIFNFNRKRIEERLIDFEIPLKRTRQQIRESIDVLSDFF